MDYYRSPERQVKVFGVFSSADPFSKFDLNCFLAWVYYFLQLSLLSFAMIIFKFLNIFSTCENTWIKVFYVWNMKKKKSAEFCSFSHVKTFSWNTMMKLWKIINFLFFLLKMFFSVSHMKKNKSGFFFSPNFRNSFHWEKRESFKHETKTKFWIHSRLRVLKESLDIHFLPEKFCLTHSRREKKKSERMILALGFTHETKEKVPWFFFFLVFSQKKTK